MDKTLAVPKPKATVSIGAKFMHGSKMMLWREIRSASATKPCYVRSASHALAFALGL